LSANCLILSGFYPKIESGYILSDILEEEVDAKYFLSEKMVKFITKIVPGQNQRPNFVERLPQEKEQEENQIL